LTVLSVVILSWNTKDLLRACLTSIHEGPGGIDTEVIVVDNCSEDGSPEMVASDFPSVRLIRNERNEGYAKGNNIGIRASRGEYILLLNSDTEVRGNALEKMVTFLKDHPEYGACGAQLFNPDGTVQRACMRFPTLKVVFFFDIFVERLFPENRVVRNYFMKDFDHTRSMDVDQPPGACFMVTKEVVDRVGILDEELWLFYNDVDWCKRIWKGGYKIRFLEGACVMHHVGGSTRNYGNFGLEWHRNRVRYYRKHCGLLGAAAAKLAAVIKGMEEVIRAKKAGCRLSSPEVKGILHIVREVLRT
jgi:GT2 family glycosyltransferase